MKTSALHPNSAQTTTVYTAFQGAHGPLNLTTRSSEDTWDTSLKPRTAQSEIRPSPPLSPQPPAQALRYSVAGLWWRFHQQTIQWPHFSLLYSLRMIKFLSEKATTSGIALGFICIDFTNTYKAFTMYMCHSEHFTNVNSSSSFR